jgi:hypothetical protein
MAGSQVPAGLRMLLASQVGCVRLFSMIHTISFLVNVIVLTSWVAAMTTHSFSFHKVPLGCFGIMIASGNGYHLHINDCS